MFKRWITATLLSLGLAVQAQAQQPPPQGGGPFAPPSFANNPMPMTGPEFCPTPGGGPPPEPEAPFSLKRDGGPNAFDDQCPGCNMGRFFYLKIGPMGLQRQGLGNGVIAVQDPGVNIPGIPANVDSGNLPPAGSPTLVDFKDLHPNMQAGVRAAIGWREGDHAFEIAGFYLGQSTRTSSFSSTGQIDLPFAAFPSPVGFQGNNFLWLQADTVQQSLRTQLASGEANYRWTTAPGFEFLFGVRYIDFRESYGITTLDDNIVVQPVNPTQIATTTSTVHNRLVGPQFGFEYGCPVLERFAIGGSAKAVWGANFVTRDYSLTRGDGFQGPSSHSSGTQFSQAYEVNVFADFLLWDQVKLRAGYQAFWMADVPVSSKQIDFNPGNGTGMGGNHGSVFFHGPMLEIQIAF